MENIIFCAVKMKHMRNLISWGDINIKDVNIDGNKLTISIFQPSKEQNLGIFDFYFRSGFGFTTVFIEGPKFMPWLEKK